MDRICTYCKNEIFADGGGDDLILVEGEWYHKNFCVPPPPIKLICASCTKNLKASPSDELDNALHIQLTGGYGMFIDHLSREDHSKYGFYICHECAHDLCAKIGWLNNIIEPHHSHSHKYVDNKLPEGHWGYDYDMERK